MAKNYTFAEAVEIINKGKDMEAIADIGRRFPILLHKVSKVAAIAGDDFAELMSYLPEHLTANKVNTSMKNNTGADVEDTDGDEDNKTEEASEPKKATKEKATKAKNTSDSTDYESMSGNELWELLGKAGKRKDCKEKMGGAKKADMIAYINKYGLDDTTEADEEVEDTEETSENPYEGISAPELFKECKKRGLKAAAKKPAKYYVELLMKADEEVAGKSESEDEDDWGDEVEEPKAEKTEKKAAKSSKKSAPAKEEDSDEDDDWDI